MTIYIKNWEIIDGIINRCKNLKGLLELLMECEKGKILEKICCEIVWGKSLEEDC